MSGGKTIRDNVRVQLQAAIDGMRKDLLRVEVWAAALDGFSKPVPNYQTDERFLLPAKRKKGG